MATDSILRLKAQTLAEAGVPLLALEKEIGVVRRTLQRWSDQGGWKTPHKINALFEQRQLQTKLSGWMIGPKGPLRVRLMYDYLVAGMPDADLAFSLACRDADLASDGWRDGAIFPIPKTQLTEAHIASSQRLAELGIEPQFNHATQNAALLTRTRDDLTQLGLDSIGGASSCHSLEGASGVIGRESVNNVGGEGGLPADLTNLCHPAVTKSATLAETISKWEKSGEPLPARPVVGTSPIAILTRAHPQVRQVDALKPTVRQVGTPAHGVLGESGVIGTPIEEYVPTIGEKDRPATILETLPRDFEGFVQVVRDSESLSRTELLRSAAYRDNISATLLKLSQYAYQLAETDPRKALIVMAQIAKMDSTAAKRFKLDDEKDSNKASDTMRRLAQREEDGEAGVVLDV